MAINPDLQNAFATAWNAQAAFFGDVVDFGGLTGAIPCFASIIEENQEDPGGGDRARRSVRIQVAIADFVDPVPALDTSFTYKTLTFRIDTIQKTDDDLHLTIIGREDI